MREDQRYIHSFQIVNSNLLETHIEDNMIIKEMRAKFCDLAKYYPLSYCGAGVIAAKCGFVAEGNELQLGTIPPGPPDP